MNVAIEASWRQALAAEFEKDYFLTLREVVREAYQTQAVFPPPKLLFHAFDRCPLPSVRVVILGQDPYHGPGQAHGLSFSVPVGVRIPPSLQNIYKEITSDIGTPVNGNGNLEGWARQGVLLLNSTLTVQSGLAGSHHKLGWEQFTDAVIATISREREHVVFLLWGSFAGSKRALVDETKHLVLTAPHPSPLSVHRGFLGCRHFSQTNRYLTDHGHPAIVW